MCVFLCISYMSSSLLCSPLNIAWANRTKSRWNYISAAIGCTSRHTIICCPLSRPKTVGGHKHAAKPKHQQQMTQFFSTIPTRAAEDVPPQIESDGEDEVAANDWQSALGHILGHAAQKPIPRAPGPHAAPSCVVPMCLNCPTSPLVPAHA